MQNYKKQFAEFLVSADALQFGEFSLKNGRVSPYFFNSSKFNTGPMIEQLGQYYASAIQQHVPDCSLIFGPAYKGIPLCVSVATALSKKLNRNIGYFFNRKEIKKHGDQGTLVGQLPRQGDMVVMVDDVFTDGLTKIESINLIWKLCKVKFSGVMVALDRLESSSCGLDAITEFKLKTEVPVWSIITIREICLYMKNSIPNGNIVLDVNLYAEIERYLEEHSIR
ncbi:MAG: orotate phosphoribosyltransferase [Deltaproteobacteria bacterium]|nr:orotate phosphoribosyltransferase [Deltaproteobacteria bacterium]